jgi:glycosyltransferase involved in cell wall biosynthesis
MTKLSGIVITYNEEENISRCLDSLSSVADEIVVVDSFSQDDTKKICLDRNVRFISRKTLR